MGFGTTRELRVLLKRLGFAVKAKVGNLAYDQKNEPECGILAHERRWVFGRFFQGEFGSGH